MAIRLLVADADASVREVIRLACEDEGWMCDDAPDGIAALKLLRRQEYQLAILDAELAELDGYTVCRHIRKTSRFPVIFIGSSGRENDRLAAFSCGGNDYVPKPFFPRELAARVKNLLEFCGVSKATVAKSITAGSIRIDPESHSVYVSGRRTQLAPREYDLLLLFAQHPHQAFSRDQLLNLVWGEEFFGSDRTVDTHVKSLRSKIRPYQSVIETIWGFGYKFEP